MGELAVVQQNFQMALASASSISLSLDVLNITHIPNILELQGHVGGDNTIQRDAFFLVKHFLSGHYGLGVFDGHTLVGNGLVRYDTDVQKQSTISMLLIDQNYAGQGLGSMLLSAWEGISHADGADMLHARVKTDNLRGQSRFQKMGLETSYTAPSPDDQSRMVSYMYKKL